MKYFKHLHGHGDERFKPSGTNWNDEKRPVTVTSLFPLKTKGLL
jgi:hypothetical protein